MHLQNQSFKEKNCCTIFHESHAYSATHTLYFGRESFSLPPPHVLQGLHFSDRPFKPKKESHPKPQSPQPGETGEWLSRVQGISSLQEASAPQQFLPVWRAKIVFIAAQRAASKARLEPTSQQHLSHARHIPNRYLLFFFPGTHIAKFFVL